MYVYICFLVKPNCNSTVVWLINMNISVDMPQDFDIFNLNFHYGLVCDRNIFEFDAFGDFFLLFFGGIIPISG